MADGVSGKALAITMVGVVLAYSGVRGKKISTTVRNLIYGNDPTLDPTVEVPIEDAQTLADLLVPPTGGSPDTGTTGTAPFDPSNPIYSGNPSTGKLSFTQLDALAQGAGFNALTSKIMAAIALAESGGDPHNIGDKNLTEPGEMSVGLWQINYRPSRDKGDAVRDPHANLDPATNAAHAYAISGRGRSFSAWTTYNTGAYRRYLP